MDVTTMSLAELRTMWEASKWFLPGMVAIPPQPEHMTEYEAGSIKFGLEQRIVNPDLIADHFENVGRAVPAGALDDEEEGPSIHVFDAETGTEYLRFDVFDRTPHYHYLMPGLDGVVTVWFDEVADGDMLPWVFSALSRRLAVMLQAAGAEHLVSRLDQGAIAGALDALRGSLRPASASTPK